jgi:hypothetical protein
VVRTGIWRKLDNEGSITVLNDRIKKNEMGEARRE